MTTTIQQIEYTVHNTLDLNLLLQTIIGLGLETIKPVPSFTFDKYQYSFKVKGTVNQLRRFMDLLEVNQKNLITT